MKMRKLLKIITDILMFADFIFLMSHEVVRNLSVHGIFGAALFALFILHHILKGDGQVTLSWSYSVDDSAGGYYIYYGNRPGEYLGRAAVQGASPVNVGNVTSATLTGLKNGVIYYFAVAAYSKLDERICGALSKEVYARPERKR